MAWAWLLVNWEVAGAWCSKHKKFFTDLLRATACFWRPAMPFFCSILPQAASLPQPSSVNDDVSCHNLTLHYFLNLLNVRGWRGSEVTCQKTHFLRITSAYVILAVAQVLSLGKSEDSHTVGLDRTLITAYFRFGEHGAYYFTLWGASHLLFYRRYTSFCPVSFRWVT